MIEPRCNCFGTTHFVGEGNCVLSEKEEIAGFPMLRRMLTMLKAQREVMAASQQYSKKDDEILAEWIRQEDDRA